MLTDQKAVTAMTMALRELAHDKGSNTAFRALIELADIVDVQFQLAVFHNLINGGATQVHATQVRLEHVAENKKISTIKHVRAVTGVTLKDAKDFIELVANQGPQILTVDGNHNAIQFIEAIRKDGSFACIV